MKINWKKIISLVVLWTLILSIIYSVVNIILAPSAIDPLDIHQKVKSDYILMFIQCLLGIVVMFLPSFFERKLRIEIPSNMYIIFIIFLYCAIYLGEVRSFYYSIPFWDTILHVFSGAMLGALGFSFVNLLNDNEKVTVHMSPLFIALFALCFAVSLGVLWEIYEFSFDGLLGLNMQKFALENGTQLVGRNALQDTMKDLIVDIAGAFVISLMGYIALKNKKKWLENFELKKRRK